MKVLISSLQVTLGASKGHLHPAIEMGLALKRRGHEVGILPLPNAFNKEDREQVVRCGFAIIEPPALPEGLPFPSHKLAEFVKNPETSWQAYHSFLVAPLESQFTSVVEKIRQFNPAMILYDLLVYAAPLAARRLGIPELGFCAGLKLIAPLALTSVYENVAQKLIPLVCEFLAKQGLTAEFHQLELLANTHQLVFTPKEMVSALSCQIPRKTLFAGALPVSRMRCEYDNLQEYPDKNFIIICFGSALDPAHYPEIIQCILKIARYFKLHIVISTRHPELFQDEDIIAKSYIPLPQLLTKTSILIHHGGANTFSESLSLGVPQLLIPLTTDQPIQAEVLKSTQVGLALYPHEISEDSVSAVFNQLLDKNNPIHQRIETFKHIFQQSHGAVTAVDLIEELVTNGEKQERSEALKN